jgi:type IV secretory pathway VirB10-like protein
MGLFKKKTTPTLSTPAPPRAATESNGAFVLAVFGLLAFVVVSAILGGVYLFSKRTNEKVLAASSAAMPVDDTPLIDMNAIKNRRPIHPAVTPPSADLPDQTPQLPPPDEAPMTAALPPPTASAPAPKKEWVKPTMHVGGGSVRGGEEGRTGRVVPAGGSGGTQAQIAGGMGPRNDREAFAATAGRGRKLYHAAGELPPLPGCVAKTGNVIQLATLGVTKNSAPGQFALKVVAPLQGVIYDQRRGPRACTHPLVPPNSTVICEPNTVSTGRGDQIIQAVCSRIDFPNGGTLPLDGFPLVAADGSVGVPAESDYPWGDVLKGMLIDIASAIPGALVTASAGALSGGGAGVILNVGADGFQQAGQQYKQDEVKIQKVLYIPKAAPTGLFIPADIALPDARR